MIRGALVFATGLALGYGKALSEHDAIQERVQAMKAAWEEASTPLEEVDTNDLSVEGINHLMTRLRDALPHVGDAPDDKPLIKSDAKEPVLTVGDIRAPFSVVSDQTTNNTTEGETPSE